MKNTKSEKPESTKKTASTAKKPSKTAVKEVNIVEEDILQEVTLKKSVLFVASEVSPFVGTGGLGDVIGSLPKSLSRDIAVSVVCPLYSSIDKEIRSRFRFVGNLNVPLSWRNQYLGIFTYNADGVNYYFLDNEYYFKRDGNIYGFFDDGERFAFFSKAVLEMMQYLNYYPDYIHANDWQTALTVIYLKTLYSERQYYRDIKTIYTIHNIEYQGQFGGDCMGDLFGLPEFSKNRIEFDGCINLTKGAIEYCDKLTTVSPTYAEELKDPYFAHGLDGVIRANQYKLSGILNGIDYNVYNPETDEKLFKNYSAADFSGKSICKKELQIMLNLPCRDDVPLVAIVSRLVGHKGLDLVKCVIEEFLQRDVQVVILGKGEKSYENHFEFLAGRYTGKLKTIIAFNKDLASKIYSAADIFLMPSKQEPCGLSQMIALRYGAIPVVRKTGGLNDSIVSVKNNPDGYGYVFDNYNAHEMLFSLNEACNAFYEKDYFKALTKRAMSVDFSWSASAKKYKELY